MLHGARLRHGQVAVARPGKGLEVAVHGTIDGLVDGHCFLGERRVVVAGGWPKSGVF